MAKLHKFSSADYFYWFIYSARTWVFSERSCRAMIATGDLREATMFASCCLALGRDAWVNQVLLLFDFASSPVFKLRAVPRYLAIGEIQNGFIKIVSLRVIALDIRRNSHYNSPLISPPQNIENTIAICMWEDYYRRIIWKNFYNLYC